MLFEKSCSFISRAYFNINSSSTFMELPAAKLDGLQEFFIGYGPLNPMQCYKNSMYFRSAAYILYLFLQTTIDYVIVPFPIQYAVICHISSSPSFHQVYYNIFSITIIFLLFTSTILTKIVHQTILSM